MSAAEIILPLCFMLELLISESIFLIHMPKRNHFAFRAVFSLAAYSIAAVWMYPVFIHTPWTLPYRLVFFIWFFACAMASVALCFRLSATEVVFAATAGYSVEHIADSLVKIVLELADISALNSAASIVLTLIVPYAAVAAAFYFLLVKGALLDEKMHYGDRRVVLVAGLNLMICLLLSVIMDGMTLSTEATIICKIYAILGCMLCLLLQAGLFQDGKMAQTNRVLQEMIQLEHNQHRISKETIDFINIKCHDLKHQITRLDGMSEEKRRSNVDQLSRAIMIYDSIIKTGNDALDMVLMEKKLLCEKYRIDFSYVADGSCLSALDEADVYSLFGNMLDNAIESLSQEQDEEKRILTLRVSRRMRMAYISVDNYCSTPVVYKAGEIQTTKEKEPGMHGYGLKSIAYIVSSYGGELLIDTQNSHFVIEIMLPIKAAEEAAAG